MAVYYSILGMLLFFGVLKIIGSKYEKSENILVVIAAVILLVFAALRSINVGADTHQYCGHFLKIAATKINDMGNYSYSYFGDIETGYKFYNKFLSVFFNNRQTITIANSVLQIGLISLLILRDSKNKWLSIFLYFTFCFYQTALNLTPSSFVSYFIFLAFPYIENKRLIPFLLFILIGMSFHTSAIFFLPLYFLYKIKLTPKKFIIIVCASILTALVYSMIIFIFEAIIPLKYAGYLSEDIGAKPLFVDLLVYSVQFIAIAFCFLLLGYGNKSKFIEENNLICWVFLFETILYIFALKSGSFSRGAFLFSPYTIVIIPKILSEIEDKDKRKTGTLLIVIYGIIVYIARVNVNNVGNTMPYSFFMDGG